MFYDWIEDLDYNDPEDAWSIVKAIGNYYLTGADPMDKVKTHCRGIVSMMMHQIKRSEIKAAAGKKGAAVTNSRSKNKNEQKNEISADTLPSAQCQQDVGTLSAQCQQDVGTLSSDHRHSAATETETETETDTKTETDTLTKTLALKELAPPVVPQGDERVRTQKEKIFDFPEKTNGICDSADGIAEEPFFEDQTFEYIREDGTSVICGKDDKAPAGLTTSQESQGQELCDIEMKFNAFWELYPKKVNKEKARIIFTKLNPDDKLMETILCAIDEQMKTPQWAQERYIPNPTSWLLDKRWEDEIYHNNGHDSSASGGNTEHSTVLDNFNLDDFFENL